MLDYMKRKSHSLYIVNYINNSFLRLFSIDICNNDNTSTLIYKRQYNSDGGYTDAIEQVLGYEIFSSNLYSHYPHLHSEVINERLYGAVELVQRDKTVNIALCIFESILRSSSSDKFEMFVARVPETKLSYCRWNNLDII
jgi:hypothetical protein